MAETYIDTSALAASISRLTVLEFRCLLARRRRAKQIDARTEKLVLAAFEADLRQGFLAVHPLEDAHAVAAVEILGRLKAHPLRSFDALHLGIIQMQGISKVATADRVLAAAAVALGIETVRFD